MGQRTTVSVFGQADPTDNRERYVWKSKYEDPVAKREIRREAVYLGILLLGLPAIMAVFWLGYPKHILRVPDGQYRMLVKYVFAWASGSLGGVLFDVKWLYHVVARGFWNMDRRLWRIFTPHISGALSFFFLALVSSGGLRIFDGRATDSLSLVLGMGFLVGYFSDSAIAKLTDVAETLFGTIRAKEKHKDAGPDAIKNEDEDHQPTTK